MLQIPTWKRVLIIGIVLVGLLYAMPNLFYQRVETHNDAITAAERARKGDDVFVLDFGDPEGRTHRWNPLGLVRRGTPDATDDLQKAMFALVPETRANNPYWGRYTERTQIYAKVLPCLRRRASGEAV